MKCGKPQLILVDDEPDILEGLGIEFEHAGFQVSRFSTAEHALDQVDEQWPGVLVVDVKLPGENGLDLMRRARALDPKLPVVLITGHGDVPMAVEGMRHGAYDFIEKPFRPQQVVSVAERAMDLRRLVIENRALREEVSAASGIEKAIIGGSPAILALRRQILRYAELDANVVIAGETGSGKELVSRCLHEYGPRRNKHFVAINCGALPMGITASELFGHEPGAFTGATVKRVGKFEYADGGTLLLDEMESMPLELQTELLRVLQENRVTRLGSNAEISIDVRVIAATKKDLRQEINEGRFREDLYYRLNVLSLKIPPLRERPEDIMPLFQRFVLAEHDHTRGHDHGLTQEIFDALLQYDWPGNVRELQNAAVRFAHGVEFDFDKNGGVQTDKRGDLTLPERLAAIEKQIIEEGLHRHRGNINETSRSLGIARRTLHEKISRYDLKRPRGD